MVERTPKCSMSKEIKNSWIEFNFQTIRIKPTHYTLRHFTLDYSYMKSWNLLGSLDGINYEIIKKHSHWRSPFKKSGHSKTFQIENVNKYYQYFKIQITGKDSDGYGGIKFNGLELYGYVCGNRL